MKFLSRIFSLAFTINRTQVNIFSDLGALHCINQRRPQTGLARAHTAAVRQCNSLRHSTYVRFKLYPSAIARVSLAPLRFCCDKMEQDHGTVLSSFTAIFVPSTLLACKQVRKCEITALTAVIMQTPCHSSSG
jgi:hypothetical protein